MHVVVELDRDLIPSRVCDLLGGHGVKDVPGLLLGWTSGCC